MYFHKISSLGLAVLVSIAVVAPSVTSRRQQGPDPRCAGTSTKMWVPDGRGPVPPYLPPLPKRVLSANSQPDLMAEGGAPVPPYPPPPKPPTRSLSTNSQPTLMANGGAAVQPYPPPPSNDEFPAV